MRWYSYLVGYLIVIIEGKFPEKVINMALIRGIFLWDIMHIGNNEIKLKVRLYAFKPLARIARKCSCRIHIYERAGLPFQIKRVRRRKTWALGGILFLLSLYILSSFIWVIQVTGNEDLSSAEIRKLAAAQGLRKGAVIRKLDIDKIEVKMQDAHPKLAWVGINVQGTKVTIEISEKVLIPDTDDNKAASLIAKESGKVEEMLVLMGTPVVKEGEEVERGQVLISGMVYPELHLNDDGTYTPGGQPELVRAKGVVRAQVSYSLQESCPIVERKTIKTGKESEQVIIKIGEDQFVLKGEEKPSFPYYTVETNRQPYSWRNIELPVELVTNTFYEEKKVVNNFGLEGAYQEAIKRAEKKLVSQISKDAKILNKSVNLISNDDSKIVSVEVTWDCLENIAVPQLIYPGNDVGTS